MQPHPGYLVLEPFLESIPNLPNYLNPNHVLNTLISPGYLLINAHLRHIAPNNNHCSISVILILITQASRCQKEATIWRTIMMKISSSCKLQLNPKNNKWETTSKNLIRKWRNSQNNPKQCLQQSQIILTLWNLRQPRRIHQILCNLPLWYQLSGELHHWMVDSLQKLVVCGIWNIRLAHQYSMNSSYRQNSKETLLCTLRTSTTTKKYVSMRWLDSEKTSFLVTSTSKDTLSLQNTSSQIVITLPIIGVFRYTITVDNHC